MKKEESREMGLEKNHEIKNEKRKEEKRVKVVHVMCKEDL